MAITDRDKARASLAAFRPTAEGEAPADGVFRNLALTWRGLKRLGLPARLLDALPAALRDGPAIRAGMVGDTRAFHPDNWRPLPRNWPAESGETVELAAIDMLIQLRVHADGKPRELHDPHFPLRAAITQIAALPGLRLLSVEAMGPAYPNHPGVDHLGFRDGLSQPIVDGPAATPWSDRVAAGDIVVGYPTGRGDPGSGEAWLKDGSYLAVRRMPIDRAKFDAAIDADTDPAFPVSTPLNAKLVGRDRAGDPLASPGNIDNFTYAADPTGALCPAQAHIRRANPRDRAAPRLMRRGMSFGPPAGERPDDERGSMFMAYCVDLAEQYEVVLRWLNGGNSTRIGSWLADPLCGPPRADAPETLRFPHAHGCHRLALPAAADAFTRLSWSLYLFAPSRAALRSLPPLDPAPPAIDDEAVARGRALIARLREAGAGAADWRALLNETGGRDSDTQRAVWAAVRADGGMLSTPAGHLVGGHAAVLEVLRDDGRRFSVGQVGERIAQSIGGFHLGWDAQTPQYEREAIPANAAMRAVTRDVAFDDARRETAAVIKTRLPASGGGVLIDLLGDLLDPILARLSKIWFDIPDGQLIKPGSLDWRDSHRRAVVFAGDYWNPSRHAFNPFQSAETVRLSRMHGPAAVAAARALIVKLGRDGLRGSVSAPMAEDVAAFPTSTALARSLTGAMIGAVPTIIGNALRLLVEGIETGELARLQLDWPAAPQPVPAEALTALARRIELALQRAPVPELVWRTVADDDLTLGGQPLARGDMVIISLESAAADQRARGTDDSMIPFGMALEGAQPPHGCPARAMALGVIAGAVAGLIETARFKPAGGRTMIELWGR